MRHNLICALAFLLCGPAAHAASGVKALDKGVARIAKQLWPEVRELQGNVCVLDFIRPAGKDPVRTEFGQLVAEKLSAELVARRGKKEGFAVMERLQLVRIMDDLGLWGAEESAVAEKLREKARMDYLISGTYSLVNERVAVTAKLVDVQTGSILATGKFDMRAGEALDRLMSPSGDSSGVASGDAAGTRPSEAPAQRLALEAALVYRGSDGKLRQVHEGMTLTSEHLYGLYLRPAQDCYVYVYQVDSKGKVMRLFPNIEFETGNNPLKGGSERWIPNDKKLFELDENKGIETIYVVASRNALLSLDEITVIKKGEFIERFKGLGLMGVKGMVSANAQRVRPLKDNPADFLAKSFGADQDCYWTISFDHQ